MASHIVVGVDGSAPATAALEWAAADAQRRGLDLRIVHVCEQLPHGDGIESCTGVLEAAADRARWLAGEVKVETKPLRGDVVGNRVADRRAGDEPHSGGLLAGWTAGAARPPSPGVAGSRAQAIGLAGHPAGPSRGHHARRRSLGGVLTGMFHLKPVLPHDNR